MLVRELLEMPAGLEFFFTDPCSQVCWVYKAVGSFCVGVARVNSKPEKVVLDYARSLISGPLLSCGC